MTSVFMSDIQHTVVLPRWDFYRLQRQVIDCPSIATFYLLLILCVCPIQPGDWVGGQPCVPLRTSEPASFPGLKGVVPQEGRTWALPACAWPGGSGQLGAEGGGPPGPGRAQQHLGGRVGSDPKARRRCVSVQGISDCRPSSTQLTAPPVDGCARTRSSRASPGASPGCGQLWSCGAVILVPAACPR